MASASSSSNSLWLTWNILKQQNAETSNAIIHALQSSKQFQQLSQFEGDLTLRRDQDDGDKLQKGIDYAKSKHVIDPNYVPEPYVTIDVLGLTPDDVASKILQHCQLLSSDDTTTSTDTKEGTVIVLVGLSGTGKGTTVSKLRQSLADSGNKVVTWSNGNIFRSVTLMAVTWCEQHNESLENACTSDNLQQFMSMLSFERNPNSNEYDTHIHGLGLDLWVNQVQNTTLKQPNVASNIPAVAEYTQGEVILFAAQAVQTLCHAGYIVLLEGREQTVNYVRSPHRFELVLSDPSLIGQRRAAQRIMASALELCQHKSSALQPDDDVSSVVTEALEQMVRDLK